MHSSSPPLSPASEPLPARRSAPPRLSWREEHHHPVVNVAQHLFSPLTATLAILAVHKASQARALWFFGRAARLAGRVRAGGGPLVAPSPAVEQ